MQKFSWKRKRDAVVTPAAGLFLVTSGEQDEEAPTLPKKKAIALEDPTSKAARLKQEGVVWAESDKWWSAIRAWDAASSLTPADHTLHDMMAQAYMQVGELVPSVRSGELAVSCNCQWWCAHQTLGRALLGMGELHKAVMCFSRALRLNPDNEELREADLKWAAKLLRSYKQLQDQKLCSTLAKQLVEEEESLKIEDVPMDEESNEDTGATVCNFSMTNEYICEPTNIAIDPSAGSSSRSSVQSARFVSCCSSNKTLPDPTFDETIKDNLDLSNMVCLRPRVRKQ